MKKVESVHREVIEYSFKSLVKQTGGLWFDSQVRLYPVIPYITYISKLIIILKSNMHGQ